MASKKTNQKTTNIDEHQNPETKQNENDDDDDFFEGKLLHLSCLWNNPELLSDLLLGDEAKNIDSQDGKGRTALHEAAISNSLECARLLLMSGADVNIKTHLDPDNPSMSSKSCLHLAVQNKNIDMVRLFLEFNVDVFSRDSDGYTAIDIAQQENHQEIYDELNAAIVEHESNLYKSLAIAVHKGDVESIDKLLSEEDINRVKSIVNYVSNGSNTLLFKACQEGHLEIAKKLIEAGADGRQHPTTRYSPLYISVYHGRLQICQLLLEHFPELTSIYTIEHWLPIHAAVMNNHQDIVQLLLNYPYPSKVMKPFLASESSATSTKPSNHDDSRRETNSSKSSKKSSNGNDDDIQYLYFLPFDMNAQDIAGQSILYLATLVGNQMMVDYLLNLRFKSVIYDENDPQMNVFDDDNDSEVFEDCLSSSNASSSPDITVIGVLDRCSTNKSSHTQQNSQIIRPPAINKITQESKNSSFRNILIDRLSNSHNNSGKAHKIDPKKSEPDMKIYLINPLKLDLYCNDRMETALHCAVKKRQYSIASLLLNNGANPNIPINGIHTGNSSHSIVTRVSHFNHNLFSPRVSLSDSLNDLKNISGNLKIIEQENKNPLNTENIDSPILHKESTSESYRFRSTALREAIRNRDKAMVDLLLRFGARDNLDCTTRNDCHDECDNSNCSMSALAIAFANSDFHFVSKLLSLKAYPDSEFKVNKKSFDIIGTNCANAINRFNMVNNFTVSSMFPSNSVMIDWHCLKINTLDESFQRNLTQWLIDASLVYNVKLKLSHIQDSNTWNTALAAITRIDLSENDLSSVPFALFTDLPSLKILNLSKNKLQTLPEMKICSKETTLDDDSVSVFRSTSSGDSSLPPNPPSKTSKTFLSMMRKSQSVTSSLSTSGNHLERSNRQKSKFNRTRSIDADCSWNLPCLEELYLQDNQLECLPASLFQQPELKILDLSNNKLRMLPPLFWFSPKLNELNLSMNLLVDLPSPINCLNQIINQDSSQNSPIGSMSKSISISSIASNLSSSDLKMDFDSNSSSRISQTNLTPFDLNILKPWSGCITVLDDSFPEQFVEHKTKESSTISSEEKHLLSKDSSINNPMKNYQTCSLTQLNLSHNGFSKIPFYLSCLATRLTHLNVSYNRLKSIFDPYYILGHLPGSLKHLDLSHNQISEWYMIDDQDLDCTDIDDSNLIRRSPCFHNYFRYQKFNSLPSPLSTVSEKSCPYKQHMKLDNLKTLILSNNHLKNIIITREELIDWIDLEYGTQKSCESTIKSGRFLFNLSSSFTEQQTPSKPPIPSSSSPHVVSAKLFSNFGGSQDDLHSTAMSEGNTTNMNYKAARYSKLFFPNLSMLDMANNQVSIIPKTISYLHQLSVLNLSANTELISLPPEMGLLTKLWNLNTRGCVNLEEPIRSMINSKSYKTCDIISYLNSILENSKPYTRLKLMIVGYQSIGKTSLLEQLRHEGTSRRGRAPPDHWGKRIGSKSMHMKTPRGVTLSTVGVDLCEWTYERRPLKGNNTRDRSLSRSRIATLTTNNKNSLMDNSSIGPITFRTWDFGGQREYYATHQYFLSKRSIYLAVWRITDGEKGVLGLHSWLVNIQSRAPNSPVIIVGTHYDLVKEFYPPFYANELQNMIRDRYMADTVDADKRGLPKIVASVEVSTKTRHNIRLLANIIYETACDMRSPGGKDRLLEQKVPATYLALEEIVTILAMTRKAEKLEPVLYADQYRKEVAHLMKERYDLAFRDHSELQQASRFLHENGVLLHYEDANLKDLYFLDPQWLCDMLAHVVTIREINPFAKNGIMKTEHLLQLFKNTQNAPSDVQSYLLNLLNKFELAITWDNRTILIPSLLPTEDQLRAGQMGWDIAIPLKSRLKMRNQLDPKKAGVKFEFKNELLFQEFSGSTNEKEEDNANMVSSCIVTALARHSQAIHRILILSYVPCGFWSRLIARVLADESVIEIVRSFYCLPTLVPKDPLLMDFLNNIKANWYCWQTGFGLRYQDTFLLRCKEFPLINNPNPESKLNFTASLKNNSYPYDYNQIRFYLRQQKDSLNEDRNVNKRIIEEWSEITISSQSSSLIEIYLPNQLLKVETCYNNEDSEEIIRHEYVLEPNIEMLTKLLVIIVEHIDTLLEDWYPSLGTRFIHTSDGRFLITRIVPCTSCLRTFVKEKSKHGTSESEKSVINNDILSPDASEVDSNLVDFYKWEVKKAALQADGNSAIEKNIVNEEEKENANLNLIQNKLITSFRVNAFMVEECILSVYEDSRLECITHGKIKMDKIAPDFLFRDLKDNYRIESDQLKFGKLLGRGSFGFVFRAYYKPNFIQKKETSSTTVSNSVFYTTSKSEQNKNYEVALKLLQPIKLESCSNGIKKADIEAYSAMKSKWERDPLQYSCKAYCTARTELNILLNLKHSNIASIIGICPKPLALVLTLAPHGSLDIHTKAYRRSGARISAITLQKTFLQISKALEYLHQQHIIYRDLKSENVLVWSFPHPYNTTNHPHSIINQSVYLNEEVHLKLADYGISRSSLPTGTKGFGGTEGFMAPEIMLFNGEEEYTEKVDCFSFAMFMYELCTLRFPFEGHEFAIRESILDGIRPAISQKDLDYLPESFIDLMTRSWAHEPSERPTMSQIVSIISAPEFCSLRDVATLSDNCALICAVGFQRTILESSESLNTSQTKFGLFLSKIGKQIDFLEVEGSKWNSIGHHLSCENLSKRTITSASIVNGNQLWLGDSTACINVYSFNESSQDELFQLVCLIQLEFENPASVTSIKSIHWLEKVNLVIICSNNGELWLMNFKNLATKLEAMSDYLDVTFTSSLLGIKRIDNNNLPTLCMANVCIEKQSTTLTNDKNQTDYFFDIWCGQTEGRIVVLTLKLSNLEIVSQSTIDHYNDAHFNQFNVPIAERNDVFLLVGASNQPFICSVLYSGYIIYHWDARKKIIIHKLDCSKLAPCSESLMSISIEDHLKPSNCRISEVAINEENDEIYVGTNFGCIIVAELRSLKPITVFRPYKREVKFIITLNHVKRNEDQVMGDQQQDDQQDEKGEIIRNKEFSLAAIKKAFIKPFNSKSTSESKTETGGGIRNNIMKNKRPTTKSIKPFITIGRGYRNLLDRFTSGDSIEIRKSSITKYENSKLKDPSKFHAIIWDSGFWNF